MPGENKYYKCMKILLKRRIENITKALNSAGKHKLADCIDKNWHKTALDYSKELNFWRPKLPMEEALVRAFNKELERLGITDRFKKDILDSIVRRRVIQTTPHLGATEGPRFFCINWLGSLGTPDDEYYIVGMYSGIPFSNHTRPGRINRKTDSINLFPSTLQDALVYRSVIPAKFAEVVDALPRKLTKYFPFAQPGDSYTKWALETCQHIERTILNKSNLVYLDINEVIASYLTDVLKDESHVLHKIFFNPRIRKDFMHAFHDEIIFYTPVVDGKYEKLENMKFYKNTLRSRSKEIPLDDPSVLINEIENGRLCPALLIGFTVIAFLNQFKCFGSFAQVEYLPAYQKQLAKMSFMKEYKIETIETSNLTTGFFPQGKHLYPVDIILSDRKFKPNPTMLFGELLIGMKESLLGSYFTGSTRNRHENKK
jgi:hypothetical protein